MRLLLKRSNEVRLVKRANEGIVPLKRFEWRLLADVRSNKDQIKQKAEKKALYKYSSSTRRDISGIVPVSRLLDAIRLKE